MNQVMRELSVIHTREGLEKFRQRYLGVNGYYRALLVRPPDCVTQEFARLSTVLK